LIKWKLITIEVLTFECDCTVNGIIIKSQLCFVFIFLAFFKCGKSSLNIYNLMEWDRTNNLFVAMVA